MFSTSFIIPKSWQDAVKSSVMNEMAKPDSNVWKSEQKDNTDTTIQETTQHKNNNNNNYHYDPSYYAVPNQGAWKEDPLQDWYLDRLIENDNNDAVVFSIPDSVAPEHEADPFQLSKQDLQDMYSNIRRDLVGTDHPVLAQAASYFFHTAGKQVRPLMVLLLSRAIAKHNEPTTGTATTSTPIPKRPDLWQAQQRLAEISEMIHTASLFHDDVLDDADTRRGQPAAHQVFGNKTAILAGDFLLARSSICLARLRNVDVMEDMSNVIEQLVRGEVMQMHHYQDTATASSSLSETKLTYYLRKSFYKTATLMAHSCKSAALLGNYHTDVVQGAYEYGKFIGLAFQLVDDWLDFEGTEAMLGKPIYSDLREGLATAPVLFALRECPELLPMMERKFRGDGDIDHAVELVRRSKGLQHTTQLAQVYAKLAMEEALKWDQSPERDGLVHLANKIVDRTR